MNLNRVLGALLGGAARPRRRSAATALLGGRSMEARAARALGAFAGAAVEAWMRSRQGQQPPPRSAPASKSSGPWSGRAPAPGPEPVSAPSRRIPETGGGPVAAPEPAGPAAEEAEALLLVRAMIAAARADGTADAAERSSITAQLDAAGLDAEERDLVLADFDRPMTPEALAAAATDPMLRARLYAAAFVGAGEITEAERSWLDRLAKALKLDTPAIKTIEERLSP